MEVAVWETKKRKWRKRKLCPSIAPLDIWTDAAVKLPCLSQRWIRNITKTIRSPPQLERVWVRCCQLIWQAFDWGILRLYNCKITFKAQNKINAWLSLFGRVLWRRRVRTLQNMLLTEFGIIIFGWYVEKLSKSRLRRRPCQLRPVLTETTTSEAPEQKPLLAQKTSSNSIIVWITSNKVSQHRPGPLLLYYRCLCIVCRIGKALSVSV